MAIGKLRISLKWEARPYRWGRASCFCPGNPVMDLVHRAYSDLWLVEEASPLHVPDESAVDVA